MNIGDYVAIYAALVATAVLIWTIWQNRKYLKFDEIISSGGNGVIFEIYITNKMKRPVNIRQVCFLDEDGSLYSFACKVNSFWKNEPITIGDETQNTITMENDSRYVFWIKIHQIIQEFDEASRYLFSYVAVVDDTGRTYKHRIPQETLNQLKD